MSEVTSGEEINLITTEEGMGGGGAERTNLTMAKIPFRGMEQKRTNITVGGGVNWMNEVNKRFPNEMRDYANLLNRSTKEEEKRREQSNHTR